MNTRDKFHAWLITQGYRDDIQALPSGTYASERVDALWGCWQAAQPQWHATPEVPVMDERDCGWPNSRVVLVLSCGDRYLAYLEQVDDDEPPRWRDAGSEGWTLKGITHWMDLPGAPS
jgi:hypothetical protein